MTEIEQTEEFLSKALYPGLRVILSKHLDSLKAAEKEVAKLDQESSSDSCTIEQKPVLSTQLERPVAAVAGGFVPIEDFAWDQGSYNSPTISIFVDLEGVGTVKQNCKISFTKSSFDLTVLDLNGKNYRLIKDNLEKDIDPEASKIVIKKDKVVIKLQKVKGEYSFETWTKLTSKKPRTEGSDKKKDPMGGIMDMMKDMYDEGDENMKKIIGEAMLKSQRGEKSQPPSLDDI